MQLTLKFLKESNSDGRREAERDGDVERRMDAEPLRDAELQRNG